LHGFERSLEQKYAGQPFAILGINVDASPATLRQAQESRKLTWPSLWDGVGGPISLQFAIKYTPTVFLIDGTGNMRMKIEGFSDLDKEALEKGIDELLRTMP
jgi:hypothetical protein